MKNTASVHSTRSRQVAFHLVPLLLSGALLGACGQDYASISQIAEEAVVQLAVPSSISGMNLNPTGPKRNSKSTGSSGDFVLF